MSVLTMANISCKTIIVNGGWLLPASFLFQHPSIILNTNKISIKKIVYKLNISSRFQQLVKVSHSVIVYFIETNNDC